MSRKGISMENIHGLEVRIRGTGVVSCTCKLAATFLGACKAEGRRAEESLGDKFIDTWSRFSVLKCSVLSLSMMLGSQNFNGRSMESSNM